MMKILAYPLVFALWYALSLLPLCVLYAFSDMLFYPLYYLVRYRRRIVRRNLAGSFPEMAPVELRRVERRFYHFFCDYMVETLKLFTLSPGQLKRRMTFGGTDEIVRRMEAEGKTFCFVYLGHYCNWEWIASLPCWLPSGFHCGQVYHPLYNRAMDRLFLRLRGRFGGECIPMKETLRHIVRLRKEGRRSVIGFISDQSPKWSSIHHWTEFFHRETPVFTGSERIGKQVDALFYYAYVTRPRRGHYHCEFRPLADDARSLPDFELTDRFTRRLEEMIAAAPAYWLWSHNRWKRTREEYETRKQQSYGTSK